MAWRSLVLATSTSSTSRSSQLTARFTRAQFRIGWLIETAVTDDEQSTDELIDVDTIFDLLAKSQAHSPRRGPRQRASGRNRRADDTNWDEFI